MLLFYYVAKKTSEFPEFKDDFDYARLREILGIA